MRVYYCSVGYIPDTEAERQMIEPGGYHVVRLPYHVDEFSDAHNMHDRRHPDAYVVQDWAQDDRSGLIWPAVDGLGCVEANLHWEAGDYTELRDRFVRDPFGAPDSTATDHRPPSPGMQCFTKGHWIKVSRFTPLSLMVSHNDTVARGLIMAQFKLTIFAED